MAIKLFASRYAGTCAACGGPYAQGDQIAWDPNDRKATKHAACSDEGAARKSAVEASRATDAEIAVPAPPGLAYMPYQRAGIAFALARPRTLIADEMGLGKTVQAIGVINATAAKRVLVICPASLKLNWCNELVRWLVAPATIYVHGAKKPAATGDGRSHEVHVINYESLKKAPEGPFDFVIVDEAHYCKNPDTQRTKAVNPAPGSLLIPVPSRSLSPSAIGSASIWTAR